MLRRNGGGEGRGPVHACTTASPLPLRYHALSCTPQTSIDYALLCSTLRLGARSNTKAFLRHDGISLTLPRPRGPLDHPSTTVVARILLCCTGRAEEYTGASLLISVTSTTTTTAVLHALGGETCRRTAKCSSTTTTVSRIPFHRHDLHPGI